MLECADLTIKEAESAKYEHTNEDDLLESIERTMNQIHKELQDQAALPAENNTVIIVIFLCNLYDSNHLATAVHTECLVSLYHCHS